MTTMNWTSAGGYFANAAMTAGGLSMWFDPSEPYLRGGRQPEFSTCTALALREAALVWDVNRYYRDLGIGAPYKPTRPEIRRAFRQGPRGPRETFCLRQLMDRETRDRYDFAPWGTRFMDEYVWAEQKEKVLAEMVRRRMDTEDQDLVRSVFRALGVPVQDVDTPESTDILDNDSKVDKDGDSSKAPASYAYGYYLWKATDHPRDREVLARWQPLVIRSLSDLGVTMVVSLGLMGRTPHEWSIGRVGYREVAYFNRETEPSAEVAAKVATALAEQYRSP